MCSNVFAPLLYHPQGRGAHVVIHKALGNLGSRFANAPATRYSNSCFMWVYSVRDKNSIFMFNVLCVAFGASAYADTCATGFAESSVGVLSAYTSVGNSCRPGDTLVPVRNAYIKTNVVRCAPGGSVSNGVCVPFSRTLCANSFVDTNVAVQSISKTNGGTCSSGVILYPARNTYIIKTASHGCGVGYYYDGTECTAYATGDGCPATYYTPSTSLSRANANGTCSTGVSYGSNVPICAVKIGDTTAGVCTPQLACAAGVTTLRTSNGMVLPIWAEKLTTPSLNIRFENGDMCYLNVLPGSAHGTINFGQINNQTYHGVE